MKSISAVVVMMVMWAVVAWGQSTTTQTPPAGAQAGSSAGAAKSTQATPGQRPGKGMAAMHEQHMQEMKAGITRMQALLAQMRSSYANMDPKDQPAMQANIELWQMMIEHMNQMVQHMEQMGGPGMGMGHGMMHGTPPATAKPKTEPPK